MTEDWKTRWDAHDRAMIACIQAILEYSPNLIEEAEYSELPEVAYTVHEADKLGTEIIKDRIRNLNNKQ